MLELSPTQQLLILVGLLGLVFAVLLVLAGLHALCHRVPPLPDGICHRPSRANDDTAEFDPITEQAARGDPGRPEPLDVGRL
jgi:hypothetical protein